jgi:hypothetical protein
MNCSSIDLKAYVLGESPDNSGEAAHIESCETCHQELERLRLTHTALLALKEEDVPQRIAFVSDKIFEPHWWQRLWHSGPAMGFASASILAAAIFVHAYARPVGPAVDAAQIEHKIQAQVNKRVDAEVARSVARIVADSQAREAKATRLLETAEKRFELQRQSDVAMMEQAGRYFENKMGQLMIASNRNDGGGQ